MRCKECKKEFYHPLITGNNKDEPREELSPCCQGEFWRDEDEMLDEFAKGYAKENVDWLNKNFPELTSLGLSETFYDIFYQAYVDGVDHVDPDDIDWE